MLLGSKVVTPDEMQRIEKLAYAHGATASEFMKNAGAAIADIVADLDVKNIILLAGKGNNGGDAYAAGVELLKRGFKVISWHVFPLKETHPLCKEQLERFKKAGGTVYEKNFSFPHSGLILDGLVGTGFDGKAEGLLAGAIARANATNLPIIAIDIPSGLNGTTGHVETVAIHAQLTLYLGMPKIGFFTSQGWNYVGELAAVNFGLEKRFVDEAEGLAQLLDKRFLMLPPIKRNRHKYEAGYLLAWAGSPGMSGAAFLSSFAALRAGAGIVRLFHHPAMELANAPWEIIKEEMSEKRFLEEAKRAAALLIGPGLGRAPKTASLFKSLLKKISLPTVIDADGLYFLSEESKSALPENCVLTPHHKEMERFLRKPPEIKNCQKFVEERKMTLVLKGAPTIIFHPHTLPLIVPYGDPGMATAGAGDVLTGIIGAILAQGFNGYDAAVLGTALHGLAGQEAVSSKTSYGLIASDLIDYLPFIYDQF